jgi:hypothetical protein
MEKRIKNSEILNAIITKWHKTESEITVGHA